jgi:hypothetical protein
MCNFENSLELKYRERLYKEFLPLTYICYYVNEDLEL